MAFRQIKYVLNEFPACCGMGIVSNLMLEQPSWDYSSRNKPKKILPNEFPTQEEAFADFCSRLDNQLEDRRENFLEDEEDELDAYYHHILVALVSKYEDYHESEQLPGLREYLLEHGWTVNKVFINPKTKNEVTVLEKVLV